MLLLPFALAASPKIVNGSPEPDFPSAVALGLAANGQAIVGCSGNLVTPRIVLTAAHCSADFPIESVVAYGKAIFGQQSNGYEAAIGLERAVIHPEYEPLSGFDLGQYDVGLMVLEEEAPVAPVGISFRDFGDDEVGTSLLSVGYGSPNSGERWSAELTVDQVGVMYLISMSDTNPEGGQICSGDSGGPQFYLDPESGRWEQWAVHSWGDSNCEVESGSTRVDVVREWILDTVEEVHGTRDLCEVNALYDDGVCDAGCSSPDPDCDVEEPDSGEPEVEEPKGRGCASAPMTGGLLLGLLGLLALGRGRRG